MSRLFSIEPVGILNAWTTNVRTKSARMTAITIDSKYSRTVDFLKLCVMMSPGEVPASAIGLRAHFEHGEKRFLWNLHLPDALHPLLAFLLLFEQFALACNVAAVTLGQHVLAHGLDRLSRDDASADGSLAGTLEH